MNIILENIYQNLPNFFQNIFVSTFNIMQYRKRYSGKYNVFRKIYEENTTLGRSELEKVQSSKLLDLIKYSVKYSQFYNKLYQGIDIKYFNGIDFISKLPIISKEDIRTNIDKVRTIEKSKAVIFKTGGTTGKSLKVYFTKVNIQERFAILDNFRAQSGYKLGKKTAWFSGKNIITSKDINKNRFWKTDYWYKVRYYSTFHIKSINLKYYVKDLIKYEPEYLVGFPSTMYDIAKYGLSKKIEFPSNKVKAIFPTAETITSEIRFILEQFFHAKVYDQYASSEGAPFIFECKNGHLHLEIQSGVFEVLDSNNKPANVGRLVVTSFTTYGTPLIRYDIGDQIELSEEVCICGNNNPVVKKIYGRVNDYIFSPEVGKINLGNISNTLKGVNGIIKFQIVQNKLTELQVFIVKDINQLSKNDEKVFLNNIRDRVGDKMDIILNFVDNIHVENSGKFSLVKNNIKEQIENNGII